MMKLTVVLPIWIWLIPSLLQEPGILISAFHPFRLPKASSSSSLWTGRTTASDGDYFNDYNRLLFRTNNPMRSRPSSSIRSTYPFVLKTILNDYNDIDDSNHGTNTIDDKEDASSSPVSPFANFDYASHWYPVIWAHDLRSQEPTQVTLFDVDYVVSKISDGQVIALLDKCPHKAAALSQGRVTSSGTIQCAYHGWSFNGTTGQCVEIPQIVKADGTMPPKVPSKSCAKAIPAIIHQEMVWLFPGKDGTATWEDALVVPPPPSVEEVDTMGFQFTTAIRDMPVDWSIIMSNIWDADHGLFAHQSKAFDLYSASKEYPIQVQESFPNHGKGYIIQTQVEATDKLLVVDQTVREKAKEQAKKKDATKDKDKKKPDIPRVATTYMHLPCHLQYKRVSKETNTTKFITCFYVCPVGVGRTRFMSAACSKVKNKRWLTKLLLDNFLDQDTYLLATQQTNILSQEAADVRDLIEKQKAKHRGRNHAPLTTMLSFKTLPTRRNLFCFSSPTEKAGAKLERFWDATLLRVPNRVEKLLQLDSAGAFLKTPSRQVVLDRKTQVLDICPDAQDVVRNCRLAIQTSKVLALVLVSLKLVTKYYSGMTKLLAFGTNNGLLQVLLRVLLRPFWFGTCLTLVALTSWIANMIIKEYEFKYTDEYRRRDMKNIPKKVWSDK